MSHKRKWEVLKVELQQDLEVARKRIEEIVDVEHERVETYRAEATALMRRVMSMIEVFNYEHRGDVGDDVVLRKVHDVFDQVILPKIPSIEIPAVTKRRIETRKNGSAEARRKVKQTQEVDEKAVAVSEARAKEHVEILLELSKFAAKRWKPTEFDSSWLPYEIKSDLLDIVNNCNTGSLAILAKQ